LCLIITWSQELLNTQLMQTNYVLKRSRDHADQNIIICGVDLKGAEFTGNNQTTDTPRYMSVHSTDLTELESNTSVIVLHNSATSVCLYVLSARFMQIHQIWQYSTDQHANRWRQGTNVWVMQFNLQRFSSSHKRFHSFTQKGAEIV